MQSHSILILIIIYFLLLLVISWYTSKNASNKAFFTGNKKSPWYIVAFGMIGTLISGVTFISVPGWVRDSQFSYMQMVFGYFLGYLIIIHVLLPLYYRMNLTSIYVYLRERYGFWAYKTGASFFLLSRTIGSAFRLYIVANVLQITVFDSFGISFEITVLVTILLIWLYTFRGGIKTVIWTDLIQTVFLLASLVMTLVYVGRMISPDILSLIKQVAHSEHSRIFFFDDWNDPRHFVKQFLAGVFISIVMTGLDQDMMQKNLSCRSLMDAQKNMYSFSLALIPVNLLFLSLGAILLMYLNTAGITTALRNDDIFPYIATQSGMPLIMALLFILGLIAAAYSSADSALTALTTSFTIDILEADRFSEIKLKRTRTFVHVMISLVLALIIILFRYINDQSVISALFTMAGYTYGPLLGLFAFGILSKKKVRDEWVPYVAILSPLICYIIDTHSEQWFNGYHFSFEILILNGLLTIIGLYLIKAKKV